MNQFMEIIGLQFNLHRCHISVCIYLHDSLSYFGTALFFCLLPFVDNLHVHGSASVEEEASHSYSYLNETGSSRNCEETLNSITRHSIAADSLALGTHVCSRHVTTANVLFRCYRHRNSTLNHHALLRGLLRKSLKFQQLALLTYQQYVSINVICLLYVERNLNSKNENTQVF